MPQVNFSLNGIPGTLWEIRRQENVHPYLGLRQAILIIDSKEKALRDSRLSYKKALLNIKRQKESLEGLASDELEIKQLEIDIAEHEIVSMNQLVIDAEMELKVANEEKTRIEAYNPDMITGTYEELQAKYASPAFHSKLKRALVVSIYSSCKMISEGASELVYDAACLTPDERLQLDVDTFQQLTQLLSAVPNPQLLTPTNGDSSGITVN